ncbi:MAG: hypothetical protein ABH863_02925 [Candidatus Micrarchaeota archaeon]
MGKIAFPALVALLIIAFASAEESGTAFQLPGLYEFESNFTLETIDVPTDPGPIFSSWVDPGKQLIAQIPLSTSTVSKVVCMPPTKDQMCVCSVYDNYIDPARKLNLSQVKCVFFPEVGGKYRINVESKLQNAYGNLTIEMKAGKPPVIVPEIRQQTIPEWLIRFAMIFVILVILSYLVYFLYKLRMRKRDAMNVLYEERQKIEDEMKVLRYRFFKREIDAATYNSLFKQKESELATANERILKSMKPRKGKLPVESKEKAGN